MKGVVKRGFCVYYRVEMPIISFSVSDALIKKFDEAIKGRGYVSRSEALRDVMRDYIAEGAWEGVSEDAVVIICIVYGREMEKKLLFDLQHEYGDVIHTLMHVHLDEMNCLEVLIGKGMKAGELAEKIRGIRGIKQVKFITTACGL